MEFLNNCKKISYGDDREPCQISKILIRTYFTKMDLKKFIFPTLLVDILTKQDLLIIFRFYCLSLSLFILELSLLLIMEFTIECLR